MNETELKLILNEKLCDIADALLFYYNPCQIKDGKCLYDVPRYCCTAFSREHEGKCEFLKENGCSFRNIRCKIWLCETAIRNTDPACITALKALEELAKLYGLTRRPFLGCHYVGKNAELKTLNEKNNTTSQEV